MFSEIKIFHPPEDIAIDKVAKCFYQFLSSGWWKMACQIRVSNLQKMLHHDRLWGKGCECVRLPWRSANPAYCLTRPWRDDSGYARKVKVLPYFHFGGLQYKNCRRQKFHSGWLNIFKRLSWMKLKRCNFRRNRFWQFSFIRSKYICLVLRASDQSSLVASSVTRLGDILNFGQFFKAFSEN